MLLGIAAFVLVLWVVGFIAYRITHALVHVLPVIGVILLALHFLTR
jgi:Family of unknown function (DUF5670)